MINNLALSSKSGADQPVPDETLHNSNVGHNSDGGLDNVLSGDPRDAHSPLHYFHQAINYDTSTTLVTQNT